MLSWLLVPPSPIFTAQLETGESSSFWKTQHQSMLTRGGAAVPYLARGAMALSSSVERHKVIIITGPTGSGKSSLAIALAKRLGGEIISADSVQVYKGLNVGSAKTPVSDRQGVPHHMLDLLDPTEEYSVGDFFTDARRVTDGVLSRGCVPIVVGGTGLYLRWYMNGRPGTPKATEAEAAAVDMELAELGNDWDAAIKHLSNAGDTETAQTLARNDWYRLRRALEILKVSGKPRGSFPLPWANNRSTTGEFNGFSETSPASLNVTLQQQQWDYDFRCYFLHVKRSELYQRLDLRCEQMLVDTEGLLQESSSLLELRIRPNSNPSSRAIGYRQAMEYLQACTAGGGVTTPAEFLSFLTEFQRASRNYAKRQLVWFRNDPHFRWLNMSLPGEVLLEALEQDYHQPFVTKAQESPWEIEQKSKEANDVKALKSYLTKNQIFIEDDDATHIREWIKATQSRPLSLHR